MVDPNRFDRVRVIEDKSMETDEILPDNLQGTKVSEDNVCGNISRGCGASTRRLEGAFF